MYPVKTLKKQIMSIVTDSTPIDQPKDYENCNVYKLYKLFASPEQIAQMEENYRRIEDAVNSLGNAIESGISIGAGITYQRLALSDDTVPEFIREAMESVYKTIIYNITGEEKISSDLDGLVISDSGEYKLADDLKIFDATKVIEQVIINSFTLVAQIITTEEMIVENIR